MDGRRNCVVIRDKDNNVIYIATPRYHSEKEIADLINMENANQEKALKEKITLENKVAKLEKDVKILVVQARYDRGEISKEEMESLMGDLCNGK